MILLHSVSVGSGGMTQRRGEDVGLGRLVGFVGFVSAYRGTPRQKVV